MADVVAREADAAAHGLLWLYVASLQPNGLRLWTLPHWPVNHDRLTNGITRQPGLHDSDGFRIPCLSSRQESVSVANSPRSLKTLMEFSGCYQARLQIERQHIGDRMLSRFLPTPRDFLVVAAKRLSQPFLEGISSPAWDDLGSPVELLAVRRRIGYVRLRGIAANFSRRPRSQRHPERVWSAVVQCWAVLFTITIARRSATSFLGEGF